MNQQVNDPSQLGEQVAALLLAAEEPAARGAFTPEEIRLALVDYFRGWAEEAARLPAGVDKDHWELVMADADGDGQVLFVVAVFTASAVHLCAGRGNARDVVRFSGSEFPDDVRQVIPDVRAQFHVPGPTLTVDRKDFEAWLSARGRP